MSFANCSVPMACPSTLDHDSIHWSRNCFHCVTSSGEAGVWAKSLAQVCAPGDERNVAARELDVFLLVAPHRVHEGPHAPGWCDVVLLGAHDEDGTRDALQAHRPAAHHELAPEELVVLVEVAHPLAKELTGKRH